MTQIAIEDCGDELDALVRRVEGGETVVVTRAGRSVVELVARRKQGGIDLAAGAAFLRAHGIVDPFPYIADDFDDPLPEDFLIQPLPEP